LAVFPEAEGLADTEMQAIAVEMNYAETTFVLPSRLAGTDARVRIFTPELELPMAGHPTVGTAFVLGVERNARKLVFELGVGPTPVEIDPGDGATGAARMAQRLPSFRTVAASRATIAALASLTADDLHPSVEPIYGSAGIEFLYIPVARRAAIARTRPDSAAMARYFGDIPFRAIYVFAPEPDAESDVRARMFWLLDGAPGEDYATGSAAGPLGAMLVERGISEPGRLTIQQGYEKGRPSQMQVDVALANGNVSSVHVGGGVVKVAEGRLEL
jgi:trans-2,3-dihydro-3-hydroxyanthranilate isomerase